MLQSSVAGAIEPEPVKNPIGTIMGALDGLEKLSKIGTKDKEMVKRLAKMIRWARKASDVFIIERDTLINTWADVDEETGEIKVKEIEAGRQMTVFRNQTEYQLQLNALLRGEADASGEEFPEPFTYQDVTSKFLWKNGVIDSELVARLGPFVTID